MKKSETKSASDRVAQQLINAVVGGKMQPGDRLSTEREFAEQFEVGRPALREALKTLSVLNIIEVRPYDGIYVAEFDPKKLMLPFKLHMEMGEFTYAQLYELRLILESQISGLAAKKMSDEKIQRLEKVVEEEDVDNPQQFAASDSELHSTIHESADNPLLQMIMAMVSEWAEIARQVTNTFAEVRAIVHKDHVQIVQAFKSRDAERCENAMRQHILNLIRINEINDIHKAEFIKLLKVEEANLSSIS